MPGAGLDAVVDRDRRDAHLAQRADRRGRRSRRDWRSGFCGTGWPVSRGTVSSAATCFIMRGPILIAPAGQQPAGLEPTRGHLDRQVHQDLGHRLALRVVAERGDAAAAKPFVQQEVEAVEPRPFEPLDLALGEMREIVADRLASSPAAAARPRIPAVWRARRYWRCRPCRRCGHAPARSAGPRRLARLLACRRGSGGRGGRRTACVLRDEDRARRCRPCHRSTR